MNDTTERKPREDVCRVCAYFDPDTHFCRLNPPSPILFYDEESRREKVSSKFPVICKPDWDYCSNFKQI